VALQGNKMVRSLKLLIIICFSLAQLLVGSHLAIAQSEAPVSWEVNTSGLKYAQFQDDSFTPSFRTVDVAPPLIEHEVASQAESDIRQTFVANVVDDGELDSVVFFYRFAGETIFTRYVMAPLSASSTYIAQIPTDPKIFTTIEYYIQARDLSGNRTVRGYTFSPLIREILPPKRPVVVNPQVLVGVDEKNKTSRVSKVLYAVGGVLLLGLIAGASSSGGNDSPSSGIGGACGPAGCLLSLTVNRPL
jgi:hypothetical protein